jgi:protein TonB
MTTLAVDRRNLGVVSDHTQGWLVSALLHGLAIVAALFVVNAMEPALPPALFQWEISMVDAPTRTESQPAEPVVQPPPPMVRPSPPVRQTKPVIAEQPPVQQEVTVPVETTQDMVMNAEPVMAYAAVASTESEPVASPPVVETTTESFEQPLMEQSAPGESIAQHTEHRLVEYRQVRYRDTRADYGWLRDTLWGRIEELKRYPALARTNHWEGKVVVSAVIRDDGEVMGVQIAETSGRTVLDEEAMAVMKKASPLRLKHPLGQRQITILIPISYRLDG